MGRDGRRRGARRLTVDGPNAWPLVAREAELELISGWLGAGRSVLLSGRAGVGKSRLGRVALDAAAESGQSVAWVSATASARAIPLGAFAHIIDAQVLASSPGPEGVLAAMTAFLQDDLAGALSVLAVDDLHLLDGPSVTLVRQLLETGRTTMLVTYRTGEPLPDALREVAADGLVEVLELQELSAGEVTQLLGTVLGDPVDGGTARRFWSITRGNPLFVRELVRELTTSGALRHDRGWWRWDGRLPAEVTFSGLLGQLTRRLPPELRSALEMVAVGEPLDLGLAEEVAGLAGLEQLERQNLVMVRDEGHGPSVTLAHPLYGEALRAVLPVARVRHVQRILAAALQQRGVDLPGDTMRAAVWLLDSGGDLGADLAVEAARWVWASGDARLAERLARAGLGGPRDGEALCILGEALCDLGRFEEALQTWSGVNQRHTLDDRVHALRGTCSMLGLVLGRVDEALALLDAALDEPKLRVDELLATEAMLLARRGDLTDGARHAEAVLSTTPSPRPKLTAVLISMAHDLLAGRTSSVAAKLPEVEHLAGGIHPAMPSAGIWTGLLRFFVALFEGRSDDAERLASERLDASLPPGNIEARMYWTEALGFAALHRGAAPDAVALLDEALTLHRSRDGIAATGCLNMLSVALSMTGQTAAAQSTLDQAVADDDTTAFDLFSTLRARAWLEACRGRLSLAGETARSAASEHRSAGRPLHELFALHDAARFGDARLVRDRVETLVADMDGAFLVAIANHVRGQATGDPKLLEPAAGQFAAAGAPLLAAEATAAAAEAAARAGHAAVAHALGERGRELAAGCGDVTTPALISLSTAAWVDPLSWREREVALLAASGLTDREIGQQLSVSVRTINAHLRSVYAKLEVAKRAGLAEALGPPAGR